MTGFVVPNTVNLGEYFRAFQVKGREIEKATGLNFNSTLDSTEADKLEVTNGGDWIMPTSRTKNMDRSLKQ